VSLAWLSRSEKLQFSFYQIVADYQSVLLQTAVTAALRKGREKYEYRNE